MKQSTSVYLIIFLIIAVFAFISSNIFATIAVIDNSNSTKLTAIEDNSFEPHTIKEVPVIIEKVKTNTTNTSNTSTVTNITNDIIEVTDDTLNRILG